MDARGSAAERGQAAAGLSALADGGRTVRWSPDSRSLAYIDCNDGVSNIWIQKLEGSPRRLTDFKSGHITTFDWSPDGTELAWITRSQVSDVVLIEHGPLNHQPMNVTHAPRRGSRSRWRHGFEAVTTSRRTPARDARIEAPCDQRSAGDRDVEAEDHRGHLPTGRRPA